MPNEVKSQIDLHDSEIEAYTKHVLPYMESRQGTATDLEDFRKRVIELFEQKCGLVVEAYVYSTNQLGVYWFDWIINDRKRAFDPDQQVHEVLHNVLDIPEDRGKGVIKSDPGVIRALEQGDHEARPHLHLPGS